MDNNTAVVFIAALVGLQNVVAVPRKERIALLSTFSGRVDENVRKFI